MRGYSTTPLVLPHIRQQILVTTEHILVIREHILVREHIPSCKRTFSGKKRTYSSDKIAEDCNATCVLLHACEREHILVWLSFFFFY